MCLHGLVLRESSGGSQVNIFGNFTQATRNFSRSRGRGTLFDLSLTNHIVENSELFYYQHHTS
jgi:hypothetical protein